MNEENIKSIGGGLQELPYDEQDFSRTAVFGTIRAEELPEGDFMVAPPLSIKDQGNTDMCTAFATSAASEDQENVILDPLFAFYVTKVLILNAPNSWGADLRSACKAHVKSGCLEEELSPFSLYQNMPERSEILDPKTWDEDHMALAYEHRKNSFFDCIKDSPHDVFDSVRAALWLHRVKAQSVITGALWRPSWTDAPNGVIPQTGWEDERGTPHAFIFKGQKYFDNEPYLVAQLSNGEGIGDKGLFYFPRSIVNKFFTYGMFMFDDMPKIKAENHIYYGTSEADSLPKRWCKIISKLLADIFNIKTS